MKTLPIQQLGRTVSRLALGSGTFSTARREEVFALLDHYRSLGGNLIDTASAYQGGRSERVIGQWLARRGDRAEIIIMDKGCVEPDSLTPAGIRQAISGGLQRLDTPCLDLWIVHRDHPEVSVRLVVDTLTEEIERGHIRAYGVSNWPVPRTAAALEYADSHGLHGPAISSPHLSLAVPMQPLWPNCLHATRHDIAWHAAQNIPLLAWSPLGHGFFSDHPGPEPDSDERVARSYHNAENLERLARARRLGAEKGATAAQVALAYVLSLPAPTVAIVGAQTVAEVESCAVASEIQLSHAELDWLSLEAPAR